MKNLTIIFTLTVATVFFGCNKSSVDKSQLVNPILGDISYESKFGHKPDAKTNNELRIKTHLEYVENLLRNKDVSELSTDLQTKRKQLLGLLHDYWTKGLFPKNYDYTNQRKPCFIDKDGTICAVGYLVEQTTSRQAANDINSKHKYDELLAINNQTVDNWVLTSGLTKEECAMIQPTYGPTPVNSYNYISPAYGISSSIIGGLNLSLNTVNGIQIGKGTTNKTVPIIGLITGAGQIALGSASFPKDMNNWGTNYTNESQKTLSMVNIGLGTTTMILSAWNLITNRKPKDKLTTWNIYGFPTQDNNTKVAFSFKRRF
ncbi:hypothetical protein A5893_06945 [Pedobacter psychrophilus]|uniref:Uncharacterized protein n=1 Tax=Pedobacter psychrophilus TaxID=1826909 RepID=A0A179DI27_9SPHI|nr:hypothetical protein [Pedobacter psychrophilus]OAQ40671.1 hypothetical protein A5893_06945 [Pedobacter psychrophilus]